MDDHIIDDNMTADNYNTCEPHSSGQRYAIAHKSKFYLFIYLFYFTL
jgi:hypothetical protein